jgi:hypothetical protein
MGIRTYDLTPTGLVLFGIKYIKVHFEMRMRGVCNCAVTTSRFLLLQLKLHLYPAGKDLL